MPFRLASGRQVHLEHVVISADFAQDFARHWIEAWNAHDLMAILSHYSDDVQISSPYVVQLAGEPSGVLIGKPSLRAYWATALARMPSLHFELLHVLLGIDSVTIVYRGVRGLAAEVFVFGGEGLVVRAWAHYEP